MSNITSNTMKSLGSTGVKIAPIVLGTMQFGWTTNEETAFKIMDAAWDEGINCFDTANIYTFWNEKSYAGKTEEIMGKWIKKSGNRNDLILASKARGPMGEGPNNQGLSRRHIIHALDQSLKRLKTKWIDLYQSHSMDDNVPIKETLETYSNLISKGKINYIGASNYSAWKFMEALSTSEKYNLASYQTLQPYYSLARRHKYDDDLRDLCVKYNIGVIPYSPLAAGFLTGKYRRNQDLPISDRADQIKGRFFNDRGFSILETLEEITNEKGITIAQGSLAWTMHQPGITAPIVGANTVEQLTETLIARDVTFNQDELTRLDEVSNINSNLIIM